MKRAAHQLVIAIMILSLALAGCSAKNPQDGNKGASESGGTNEVVQLKYWVPFSGSDGEFMENMVKAFNESQSEIKVEFMNNNWDNYYPKLLSSLVSKSAPDVAVAHVSHLAELMPTNMIESIDDLAADAGLDWSTYAKNQENAVVRDGKHYAIPLDTHAVIMYYNKKYLGEAGLLNEDGSIKMEPGAEGFTEMLRTLKQNLPNDVSPMIVGSNNVFTYWIWYALVQQQGGTYFKDGQPTIDTPEGKQAMELMQTWLKEGLMPADIGDNSYDIFKTSKAAVTFTGVWATGNFEKEASLDFAAAPFPQLYDQPAAWGDSHTLIIPKQDDHKKQVAAVKFADWLASNGAMWAQAGHVPAKPSVLESEDYKALPYRADYAAVMDDVKYMPDSPKLGAVNDAVLESLVKINYGQASVDEGLQEAQKKAEQLMSR
ncbi:ABC transporter substrate-binding protein [Paenibacillus sp. J2TS4]|uniref:ABC transporter substrate-binding protein n=1 Tax=Paenibacillus sp. J2TS4 TaxID=2807194 RepID=UPI001B2CE655|nr:ABC transporter substrate-binding protein [Paenibacillus sp. J2TS4]GIP33425.1 ABC transporter substrate-binding protein [Paenibacillus sp. J2TS4]